MSFKNIQNALDYRLSTLPSNTLDIAWEGTNYKITNGQAFIRTTNISAVSNQLDLSNTAQDNVGIYQIDVFYPIKGKGTGELLEVVDDIFTHFKGSLTLNSSGTEVHIRNISRLPLVNSEATWMICGIQINYTSFF